MQTPNDTGAAPVVALDDEALAEVFHIAPEAPANLPFFQRSEEDKKASFDGDDRPPVDMVEAMRGIVESAAALKDVAAVRALIHSVLEREENETETGLRYWLAQKYAKALAEVSSRTVYNGKVRVTFVDSEGRAHELSQPARRLVASKLRTLRYAFVHIRNMEIENRKSPSAFDVEASLVRACERLVAMFADPEAFAAPPDDSWTPLQVMSDMGLAKSREQARRHMRN